MEERSSHLTIVVGTSAIAEELRRSLVQRCVAHAGLTTHVRGLRRSIIVGENDLVVVCIALDSMTIERHGESLRNLLADHHCFPQTVLSVGLLTEIGLTSATAEMGCDLYVHDSQEAVKAVRLLTRHWERVRASRLNGAEPQAQGSMQRRKSMGRAWTWGGRDLPPQLAELADDIERTDGALKSDSTRQEDFVGRPQRAGDLTRSSLDSG
jgi:hypothetical protein